MRAISSLIDYCASWWSEKCFCTLRVLGLAIALALGSFPGKALAQFAEPYRVNGIADVDASLCEQQGPTGQVTNTFWVLRRYDVAGPTQVSIAGVPANVTVALSSTTLSYPGWVVGEQVTATFTFNGGATIADSVAHVDLSDSAGNSGSFAFTIHGICARHNKDFSIRGAFFSTHRGVTFPVAGALVEIYREVPYWADQHVGSIITDANGSFDKKLWASDEDTYYAKLRLNDLAGVYLHDAGTPEIRDYNSVNRGSNAQPVIDLGNTVISRDGGSGTPRTAVWQSGHWARQEFVQTFGMPAPVDDYEIVIENTISGFNWSLRSKTHWEEGTGVYKFSNGAPTAQTDPNFDPYFSQFENYDGLIHEFAHTLRQTADGDDQHFFDDIVKYTLGQEHDLCHHSNEGHAFNEGWAEFWAMDTGPNWQANCAPVDVANMSAEGAVMNDIWAIARAVDACLPPIADATERAKQERRSIFVSLRRHFMKVHSDSDLRGQVQEQFPSCALTPVGVGVSARPLAIDRGGLLAASIVPTAGLLQARAAFYRGQAAKLSAELVAATRGSHEQVRCKEAPCKEFQARLLKPIYLKAQVAYAKLVAAQFALRIAEARENNAPQSLMSKAAEERAARRLADFDRQTRKIAADALMEAQRALEGPAARDRTGSLRARASALRLASRRLALKTTDPMEVYSYFKLPPAPNDDQTSLLRRSYKPPKR